ncbi:MAG: hypothetical protein GY754_22385 [bacterium]|nr:hypothetical protein [bacterium]
MDLSRDHFPLSPGVLNTSGENTLAIAFEDTTIDEDSTGVVEELSIVYNREEKGRDGNETINVSTIKNRSGLKIITK